MILSCLPYNYPSVCAKYLCRDETRRMPEHTHTRRAQEPSSSCLYFHQLFTSSASVVTCAHVIDRSKHTFRSHTQASHTESLRWKNVVNYSLECVYLVFFVHGFNVFDFSFLFLHQVLTSPNKLLKILKMHSTSASFLPPSVFTALSYIMADFNYKSLDKRLISSVEYFFLVEFTVDSKVRRSLYGMYIKQFHMLCKYCI